MQYLIVALGGALGAMARFGASRIVTVIMPVGFPWGTLVVNVVGSFMAGAVFGMIMQRADVIGEELKLFVIIGFLGAFTTFSTFSLEVVELLQHGLLIKALLNIVLNVAVCVLLAWLGMVLVQK